MARTDASYGRRTALVTGGTGSLGQAIAATLAADGFDVAVAYVGDIDRANRAIRQIRAHGRRGAAFTADVADEESASALFSAVEDRFGRLDIVVHTAGICHAAPLADLDPADLDEIHQVSIRSTFIVDQQAARRVHAGGAIVNVSSSMADGASPALNAYLALDAVVGTLTGVLAEELRGRDITVNAVAQHLVATEEHPAGCAPPGRPVSHCGVADVVSFLAGPRGRSVSGQVIRTHAGLA